MPTKRAILAEVSADELRVNVDCYEFEVRDRRVKAQLVDALARSRQARIGEILQDLSRDRLKELCRAFALADSGRKKTDLVNRLIGASPPSRTDRGGAPSAAPQPAAQEPDLSPDTLSVAQLETHLWSAA